MAWGKPVPLEMRFGEPVHLLVARACYHDAIKISGEYVRSISYHFVGPHGIEYRGKSLIWGDVADEIAGVCEKAQSDFNERTAAMNKAIEYATKNLSVPPLFRSLTDKEAA